MKPVIEDTNNAAGEYLSLLLRKQRVDCKVKVAADKLKKRVGRFSIKEVSGNSCSNIPKELQEHVVKICRRAQKQGGLVRSAADKLTRYMATGKATEVSLRRQTANLNLACTCLDPISYLSSFDIRAAVWWRSQFGPVFYVWSTVFLRNFASSFAGIWLEDIFVFDREMSLQKSVLCSSGLTDFICIADFALMMAITGSSLLPKQHFMTSVYDLLTVSVLTPCCDHGIASSMLTGGPVGAHVLYLLSDAGVIGISYVTDTGIIKSEKIIKTSSDRFNVTLKHSIQGRSVAEVLELAFPTIYSHLLIGNGYSVPWGDPRGELQLWSTPQEASQLQRTRVLVEISSLIRKRLRNIN